MPDSQKTISLLGSTGSIGQSTLNIVRHLPDKLRVVALAARSKIDLLEAQAREFHPELIAVYEPEKALELQRRLPGIPVVAGMEGLCAVAAYSKGEMLVSAMSGTIGIVPTVAAIEAGKDVALANKEVLVSAGEWVMQLSAERGVKILPIDSEHMALFQCLKGEVPASVRRLILTASGGPFLHHSVEELTRVSVQQALAHPNWQMGSKVTIDCSTLMNKGLEVIEAHWLFGIPLSQIEVVVHPQSIIHSMVEFIDGSILAQMGEPDMRIPIQYALTYPERYPGALQPFDFLKHNRLDFQKPDHGRFACLELCFEALRQGGSAPCFLNAANEVLVTRFLNQEIGWVEISRKLEALLLAHQVKQKLDLRQILETDTLARELAALS